MSKSNPPEASDTVDTKDNGLFVYNLEFPFNCKQFTVFGYTFRRTKQYAEGVKSLHRLLTEHFEFERNIKTGTHAITGHVQLPIKEKKPIISWADEGATALNDILLLLSIFTEREVFALEQPATEGKTAITADPREYQFGLSTAIPCQECEGQFGERYNCGFAIGVESVYKLIRGRKWKKEYGHGRFLTLYRSACRRQILETSFIICWTIWEILFTLHNQSWLSDDQIKKLPSSEKISYIITKYEIKKSLDTKEKKGIRRFSKIRNALIHDGRFLDHKAANDAVLFVRITNIIIAKILGLSGSDVLGSQDEFLARLRGNSMPVRESS